MPDICRSNYALSMQEGTDWLTGNENVFLLLTVMCWKLLSPQCQKCSATWWRHMFWCLFHEFAAHGAGEVPHAVFKEGLAWHWPFTMVLGGAAIRKGLENQWLICIQSYRHQTSWAWLELKQEVLRTCCTPSLRGIFLHNHIKHVLVSRELIEILILILY